MEPPTPPEWPQPMLGQVLFFVGWWTDRDQLYWILELLHPDGRVVHFIAHITSGGPPVFHDTPRHHSSPY